MPPLIRQRTRDSQSSWWSDRWSDSDPPGPSINLNAATKPFMKLMYDRQALTFIKSNRESPLSKDAMSTYSSYLGYKPFNFRRTSAEGLRRYKQVSSSTRLALLEDLGGRVQSEEAACIVVQDPVFSSIVNEFLRSADTELRVCTCWMLRKRLGCGDVFAARVMLAHAAHALASITHSPEGRQAAMDADVLQHVTELLQSSNPEVRALACTLLLVISCPPAEATLGAPCPRLITTLVKPYEYQDVNNTVAYARGRIAKSRDMQAAMDAKMLAWLPKLPQSPAWMWPWMRRVLAELAIDETREEGFHVISSAKELLKWMAASPEGVGMPVHSHLVAFAVELFELRKRGWSKQMVAWQPGHAAATGAAPGIKPCKKLLSFLRGPHDNVLQSTLETMTWIAALPEGTRTLFDANVLDFVAGLLESPNPRVRQWTCRLLATLAHQEPKMAAVIGLKHGAHIVTLLRTRDTDSGVVESAAQTLTRIAVSPEGAQAVINAEVLSLVYQLLQSSDRFVVGWACKLLGELAGHRLTSAAVLSIKPCTRLVKLLRNRDVVEWAEYALYRIAHSPEGAQAIVGAHVLDLATELLESRNARVQELVLAMLSQLSSHKRDRKSVAVSQEDQNQDGILTSMATSYEQVLTMSLPRAWMLGIFV
ncbi:armadillo-type protein [Mycena capillaripes]|nr:armadillo-type protein [Mycena capillaripes]